MTTSTLAGHFDVEARLQYLDAQIAAHLADRAREAEAAAAQVAAPVEVPMPRRVRVFLRNAPGHGAFAQLTTTRPVLPRPRGFAPA